METRLGGCLAALLGVLGLGLVGGYGSTLFWSAGFGVWACACVAAGVLAEVWLRNRAWSRGHDPLDRPVLLRPAEWSVTVVLMAGLIGADQAAFAFVVPTALIAFPAVWRDRRRSGARAQGHVDGPS